MLEQVPHQQAPTSAHAALGFCRKPQRRSFETISRTMSQVHPRVQSGAPLLCGSPCASPGPSQEEDTARHKKSWLRRLLRLPTRAQSSRQAWQRWVPGYAVAAAASIWCCCRLLQLPGLLQPCCHARQPCCWCMTQQIHSCLCLAA